MTSPTNPFAPSYSAPTTTLVSRPKLSDHTATVDEYILWLTEHAHSKGMYGMSTEMLSKEKFGALFTFDPSVPVLPPPDEDSLLNMALGDSVKDIERDDWLMKVMKENVALLPKVKEEINKRLLEAGAGEDFIRRSCKKITLLMRVAKLEDLKNPPPAPRPKIVMWVEVYHYNVLSSKDTVKLYVNKGATFDEFLELLKDASIDTARITLDIEGGLKHSDGGFWVYQLLNRSMQIRQGTPKVILDDERAYKNMLKQLKRNNQPSVVLCHQRIVKWEKEKKAELKALDEEFGDGIQPEPLDEDGKPYFDQNPNWPAVYRKFLKDNNGGFPGWEQLPGSEEFKKGGNGAKEEGKSKGEGRWEVQRRWETQGRREIQGR